MSPNSNCMTRREFIKSSAAVLGGLNYVASKISVSDAQTQDTQSTVQDNRQLDYEKWRQIELESQMRARAILNRERAYNKNF